MKEFRKNQESLVICEECNKTFKNSHSLIIHIRWKHNEKEYYDKWLKEKNEGLCKICKSKTEFISITHNYKNCCCKEHKNKWNHIQIKKSNKEKYGVEYPFQLKSIQEKCVASINSILEQDQKTINEKRKNTCIKKYGVEISSQARKVKEKRKQTCLNRFGVENPWQSEEKKKKIKKSNFKNFGVDYPLQNLEIFEKSFKTRILIHKYKNTNLTYQGSFERHFLDKFYNKIDIENAPSIKYIFEEKNKIYHPDFFIPSLNLIVEIKNSYLAKRDKEQIKAKEKATISNGYNYIMIIDKNYIKFRKNILNNQMKDQKQVHTFQK